MTTTTKVILGIVGAAAVGVAIGMILAPEKADEIKQRVKDCADDWTSQISDLFSDGKKEFDNIKSRAGRSAKDIAGRAGDQFDSARENFS